MQDKIQEIMGLVETYGEVRENYGANRTIDAYSASAEYRSKIESKLRELVREPLSDEQIAKAANDAYMAGKLALAGFTTDERGIHCVPVLSKSHYDLVRAAEAAHGITNTSN